MCLAINFTFFLLLNAIFQYGKTRKIILLLFSKLKNNIFFSKRFLTSKFIFNIGWGFVSKQEKHGYGWPWLMVVVEELGFTGIYYTILAC